MGTTSILHARAEGDPVPAHHANPVVAFIIGLAIILLASILNAAGLNLTKLDHVRTSAIPKASRRKDWLRPLWLLGMLLYILSQLIGSTLALEYMRAEYVAPLGSTSLVFNFLFARFLVGTPVTSTDIYGTIIVVLGVIGIVAFGAINSGLSSETDVVHLTYLWRRGGWLGFFFCMSFALIFLMIFTSSLDAVLSARSDLSSEPFSGISARRGARTPQTGFFGKVKEAWQDTMGWVMEKLEVWTAPKDDKTVAWTLGIGWACCGGGLAGGTLVFAKATVKLVSGSLSHENEGNQFGHAAPIFQFIFLAVTAVLQIICLNRGLKVYDSTLVVPVFYGVYTATGFLDSLIFNDEVDAYKSWTLFLIFVSILVLISGVVLLTHKKPDSRAAAPPSSATRLGTAGTRKSKHKAKQSDAKGLVAEGDEEEGDEEDHSLRRSEEGGAGRASEEVPAWAVGDDSDDEFEEEGPTPTSTTRLQPNAGGSEEGVGLMGGHPEEEEGRRLENGAAHGTGRVRANSALSRRASDPFKDQGDEFGEFESARESSRR